MAKVVHLRNIKRALQLKAPSNADCMPVKFVVGGRVSNFRTYRAFNFVDLTDGSTKNHFQLVIKKELLKKPELGSYIICRGAITPSQGTQQATEFKVDQLEYLGGCDPARYPLAEANKTDIADAWFRQNLHLRPRASHFASLLRIRSELEMGMHMILKQMDFIKVNTPILTSNDSEASSDLFMVQRSKLSGKGDLPGGRTDGLDSAYHSSGEDGDGDDDDDKSKAALPAEEASPDERRLKGGYFRDKDVFLATSAQLHLESLAASLSRVYCVSAAFRAESTMSQRHLCEFTMLEAEEANVASLETLMDRVETVVKFCLGYLAEVSDARADLAGLLDKYANGTIYETLAHSSYVRMTYDEAVATLQRLASASKGPTCQYGSDLNRKHERALLEHCNSVPIFLTNYPKSLKPFYMKACDSAPDKVQNFDLIAPFGGEICGGSLREDNLGALMENLNLDGRERGATAGARTLDPAGRPDRRRFGWYLELREFGTFPHGGYGLGLERLMQSMLGIKNIKDTIAFPRWPGNCSM